MNKPIHSMIPGIFSILWMLSVNVVGAPVDKPARDQAIADARAGRWEQAEPVLAELAMLNPADADACAQLAVRRLQQQRSKEAVELLERAVAVEPNRPELQSQLGEALSQRIGEVSFVHQAVLAARMRGAFEKSVALDPNHVLGLAGLARYFLNSPAVAGGSVEKAEEYALRLEKLDPFRGAVHRGMIRERSQNWAEAVVFYQKALPLQPTVQQRPLPPNHPWLHAMLGRALAGAGRPDEARAEFETALKFEPDNAAARDGLAALQPAAGAVAPGGR